MDQPRLSGFTSDARAYELTADTAAQDMTKPDIVESRTFAPRSRCRTRVRWIEAVTGIYDAKGEMLKLDRNIEINSSTGYQAACAKRSSTFARAVVSEQPVEVKMLQGTLNANRLDIFDFRRRRPVPWGVVMDMRFNQSPSQEKSDNR